jgi:hypothetical protein
MEYEGNEGRQGMNCKKNSTYCDVHGKPYSSKVLALMRNTKRDTCFACKPSNALPVSADYTLSNSKTNPEMGSPETDEILRTIEVGVKAMDILDLVEDGIQYGRPTYKQVKYAIPLGGYEYAVDGFLQLHDDWNKDLTIAQRVSRVAIRSGESAVTDGASILVGTPAGAASGGVGYVVGSYATSVILDSFFVNNANPYMFNRFLGGP